jgi:putative phage-type endonuclease
MDDEKDFMDLTISILLVFLDYMHGECASWIMKETYEDDIIEQVSENFEFLENHEYLCKELIQIFGFEHLYPKRSYYNTFSTKEQQCKQQVEFLQNLAPQEQRTPEWYQRRHNLITASSASKMFGSRCEQNSLIFEKCEPVKIFGSNLTCESALHHGQQYEPLSAMIYENMFQTHLGEFGCIQHPVYPFLGASPDGINIDPDNTRYGRMVEIKNPKSRKINGIPKKEYWIQMQLQMETCNLNETDFLETEFQELNEIDENEFFQRYKKQSDWNYGIMLRFFGEEKFIYENMPFHIVEIENFQIWKENMIQNHSDKLLIKTIFWKLNHLSCVVVPRNKLWFEQHIDYMSYFWKTIENEKLNGYSHRAPTKKLSDLMLRECVIPFD